MYELYNAKNLMFIGPCIVVIVEEQKTNLMSLAILFHFLRTQHVSDINISVIRSCDCAVELPQNDRCGNSTAQSQAPDDRYINVRNMLST